MADVIDVTSSPGSPEAPASPAPTPMAVEESGPARAMRERHEGAAAERAEKRKREIEQTKQDIARLEKEADRAASERVGAKGEVSALKMQKAKLEGELKKREGAVNVDGPPRPFSRPRAEGELPLPEELLAPALMAWDCAQAFHKQLKIACYSLDDFAHAVKDGQDSVLLIETVRNMLRLVLHEGVVGLDDEDGDGSEEESEAEDSEASDDEEEDSEEEETVGRKRKAPRRLGQATPKKDISDRRRRSVAAADAVTPRTWEAMLKRALRGLCKAAAGPREGWFSACALATDARRRLAQGAHFRQLPLNAKVGALAVLALAVFQTRAARLAADKAKAGQEAAVRKHKERERASRSEKKDETAPLREEALEQLTREKASAAKRAAKAFAKDPENAKKPKDAAPPTQAEVNRRVEQLRKNAVIDNRKVLSAPPADEPVSEDEEEPEDYKQGRAAAKRNARKQDERDRRAKRAGDRKNAQAKLKEAVASKDPGALKYAIRLAKSAELVGDDDGKGNAWLTEDVKRAMFRLNESKEKRDRDRKKLMDQAELGAFGLRREPLGEDRSGARYWSVDAITVNPGAERDDRLYRIFVQALGPAPPAPRAPPTPGAPLATPLDDLPPALRETSTWLCYSSRKELKQLFQALSDDVPKEAELKIALAVHYGADEPLDPGFEEWRTAGHPALRQMVQRKFRAKVTEGVVTGWLPAEANVAEGETEGITLFHVEHGDGDEEDLEEDELEEALEAHRLSFRKYTNIKDARAGDAPKRGVVVGLYNKKELQGMGYSQAQIDELVY